MNWFKSTGKLIYDPYGRHTRYKDRYRNFQFWWLLLICDNDIIGYYNYWLKKQGIYLQDKSLYGSHVSIVKGEEPPDKPFWKKYHKQEIEFQYSDKILNNHSHYWVWAKSPMFSKIRVELGLTPVADMKFHLTVGRTNFS